MDTYNYMSIYTIVFLQFHEQLYNHRNFVIRTGIRVLIFGYTYNYMST